MFKVKVNDKKESTVAFETPQSGTIDSKPFSWDNIQVKEGVFHIIKDNKSFTAQVVKADTKEKTFTINVNIFYNESFTSVYIKLFL